jgi:hypothetical protein
MAAHIAGQIRQDQLSAEGADAVLGRLLAHNLRPARRRPRAPRGLVVEIPAVKARCRAIHRPEGIERRRWRRMLTWSWRAAARAPSGGHPRRSRKVSLPFGNAACTGQSGAETMIPLRAAASGANLKL